MRNGGIQIRISDLLFILQKRWKTILALTVLGLVFGLALSGMTYVQTSFQTFSIGGSCAITTQNAEGRYINGSSAANNNDFHLAEDMVDAVRYVLRSDKVLNAVINNQALLGVTVDDLRSNLTIEQYKETQILEITLTWRTPAEGLEIWNALFSVANQELPRVLQLGSLALLDQAEASMVGMGGTSSLKMWILLTALGFAVGVGVALMELLVHPTLNNVRDVETMLGLETLAVVPQDNRFFRKNGSLLSIEGADASEVVQSYSAAAYILRNRLGTKEEHHCLFVTSADTQEGKTSAAAHLAVQLSDMEHRTLLIDFNPRNPGLGSLFLSEVDYAHSLNALYRGEATTEEAVTHLTGYLDLLPTVLEHTPIPMDSTVEELILQLTERYEYVIIDAAPVGQVSDTLSLNRVASAAVFVVGYDTATIPDIQASLEKLDKSGIRVVGCIVNGVSRGKSGGKREDLPKAIRKKTAPREETFPAPAERDLIEEMKAPAAPAPSPAPVPKAAPARPRNIMDDLISEPVRPDGDEDVMSALFQMGITPEAPKADSAADASTGDKTDPA